MASSTRKTILVVASELDESELRCSTWSTVPENILPESRNSRGKEGSNSAEEASISDCVLVCCASAPAVNPQIAIMENAILQAERTSSLTVWKAAL
jgi:hypothetical protein